MSATPDAELRARSRAEKIVPGIWRLRVPVPWPGVPHVNAWVIESDHGPTLVDTGIGGPGGMLQLESALAAAGYRIEQIVQVVCTHSHADHFGLAGPIVERASCPLWAHPSWAHIRRLASDPEGALLRRLEVARQSGVPIAALERYKESSRSAPKTFDLIGEPDHELINGVEIETGLGTWQVYETPGHAPSHVVLHHPERRLMLSGDHLLGRVLAFFDYGHTPDPVGEFLESLEVVRPLVTDLCLSGHGRPFRDIEVKIEANREMISGQLDGIRSALGDGARTGYEVVAGLLAAGGVELSPATAAWGLQVVLSLLDHLEVRGEISSEDDGDERIWGLVKS